MVATDTVVGIVGALVLVAVMAGVFVYEYNNAPEGETSDTELQEHFEEDYGVDGIAATQDLDGDGTPNYKDADIDGDGVNNTEDDMLSITVPVSGTVAQRTPAGGNPFTMSFTVANGTEALTGSFTYTRTGGQPVLEATLTGPGGFERTGSSSGTTTITVAFDVAEALAPGEYTLTVEHAALAGPLAAGPEADLSGSFEVHYASPAVEAHGHT